MERFVCVHGHFYQPPRENPWTGEIEAQDSAAPFHDWNERVSAECYRANTAARILDDKGRIESIVNNYASMSFNFGPTLLSWLERRSPETYRAVLDADRESRRRFSGHGSAMAQPYNHMILPLASARDRRTQVLWGVRDFERRFGRRPEGMWLPETAVDADTLECLCECGLQFTVLAPRQARRVRRSEDKGWEDAQAGLDTGGAYRVRLPSGRSICVFFYDGRMSLAVAFEGLLSSGEAFAERLASGPAGREGFHLVNVATDGETYGHHHRYGEMALAYALKLISQRRSARLTNYAEFLALHPPRWEAELVSGSSWSCAHGLERWRSDCGCSAGGREGWRQAWRGPLREALDWLRDEASGVFERGAAGVLRDPWAARDAYIDVVLDRSPRCVEAFLRRHGAGDLDEGRRARALQLLEMQLNAMLMYTSCGWFFADVSGIETVQILQYAARACELAEDLCGRPFHEGLARRLERAPSNLPEHRDAGLVYERLARRAGLSASAHCATFALESLFSEPRPASRLHLHEMILESSARRRAGRSRLSVGRLRAREPFLLREGRFEFAALNLGDHSFHGGVRPAEEEEGYLRLESELCGCFDRGDFSGCVRRLSEAFGGGALRLGDLFKDDRRRLVGKVVESTLREAVSAFRQVYAHHAPLLRFLKENAEAAPKALSEAAEIALRADLLNEMSLPAPDARRIASLLEESERGGVPLGEDDFPRLLAAAISSRAEALSRTPESLEAVEALASLLRLGRRWGGKADAWRAQNILYRLLRDHGVQTRRRVLVSGTDPGAWEAAAAELCELLGMGPDFLRPRGLFAAGAWN
jgi:alpha-amylase/alpha-mannosidase (GH57 family)